MRCNKCKEAIYCSQDCRTKDSPLHARLCNQAADFPIIEETTAPQQLRVMILHAKKDKVEFAWATKTDNNLKIDHPALDKFQRSRGSTVATPDLVNKYVREFQLTQFLGRGVLVWTLCKWREQHHQWLNQTAAALGGPPGHSDLLYGPLIVTAFKQDIIDLTVRFLDHVGMRQLRQVADYLQMLHDNPCIPNPSRFLPLQKYAKKYTLLPGIKINDNAEQKLLGLTKKFERVSIPVERHPVREQWLSALPFVLGLRWLVRMAAVDMVKPKSTGLKGIDACLTWLQWDLKHATDFDGGWRTLYPKAEYVYHDRTVVVFHAGGAPLHKYHVHALVKYIQEEVMSSDTSNDSSETKASAPTTRLSKARFAAFWDIHYGHKSDAPVSPYELEEAYPTTVDELAFELEHIDLLAAHTLDNKEVKASVLSRVPAENWAILKVLAQEYGENKHEELELIIRGINARLREQRITQMPGVAGQSIDYESDNIRDTIRELFDECTRTQLQNLVREVEKHGLRAYIDDFKKSTR